MEGSIIGPHSVMALTDGDTGTVTVWNVECHCHTRDSVSDTVPFPYAGRSRTVAVPMATGGSATAGNWTQRPCSVDVNSHFHAELPVRVRPRGQDREHYVIGSWSGLRLELGCDVTRGAESRSPLLWAVAHSHTVSHTHSMHAVSSLVKTRLDSRVD